MTQNYSTNIGLKNVDNDTSGVDGKCRKRASSATFSNSAKLVKGIVPHTGQTYWSEIIYDGPRYQDKTDDNILDDNILIYFYYYYSYYLYLL